MLEVEIAGSERLGGSVSEQDIRRLCDLCAARLGAHAGRPNVGQSTLLNCLAGQKLSIVSDRPQTTRRVIRGVISRGDTQIVLVDLPGTQRPRDALTARLARRVQQELREADSALLM